MLNAKSWAASLGIVAVGTGLVFGETISRSILKRPTPAATDDVAAAATSPSTADAARRPQVSRPPAAQMQTRSQAGNGSNSQPALQPPQITFDAASRGTPTLAPAPVAQDRAPQAMDRNPLFAAPQLPSTSSILAPSKSATTPPDLRFAEFEGQEATADRNTPTVPATDVEGTNSSEPESVPFQPNLAPFQNAPPPRSEGFFQRLRSRRGAANQNSAPARSATQPAGSIGNSSAVVSVEQKSLDLSAPVVSIPSQPLANVAAGFPVAETRTAETRSSMQPLFSVR